MRTKKSNGKKIDVYEMVTNNMIKKLEEGTVPWNKPWKGGFAIGGSFGFARNLVSKKFYKGINMIILGMSDYESPWWVTYKQAQSLGGQVRGGEESTLVTFWKTFMKEEEDEVTGEKTKKKIFMLKYYRVFNVEQCDGLEDKIPAVEKVEEKPVEEIKFEAIAEAEQILSTMRKPAVTTHKGHRACYSPAFDRINLPAQKDFNSPEEYYCTRFHEVIHSTGHSSRVARHAKDIKWAPFGTKDYSKEELVAEMGASFLCAITGIENKTIDNSASYIASWLKKLQDDKKFVVIAAAQAQKAVEYVLGIEPAKKEEVK